ncbi:winged helix-turn-helix domain-containing protein [Rhizobium glycinendophyticum]
MIIDRIRPVPALDAFVVAAREKLPHVGVICLDRCHSLGQACSHPCELRLESPFNPGLLMGFLRPLRHRLSLKIATDTGRILQFADLSMDVGAVKVLRAGREVPLTALQFRLLRRLLLHPSRVCDREDLIRTCWPRAAEVEPRTVDVHMGHIRRALSVSGPNLIRTIRGRGYALEMPISS